MSGVTTTSPGRSFSGVAFVSNQKGWVVGVGGTILHDHADDLRDHVTRALQHHRVAHAGVQTGDLVDQVATLTQQCLGVARGLVRIVRSASDCARSETGTVSAVVSTSAAGRSIGSGSSLLRRVRRASNRL